MEDVSEGESLQLDPKLSRYFDQLEKQNRKIEPKQQSNNSPKERLARSEKES